MRRRPSARSPLRLRRDLPASLCAMGCIGALSWSFLALPEAFASTELGLLMIVGASFDARYFLLPDLATLGGAVSGFAVTPLLSPEAPEAAMAQTILRALALAMLFEILRAAYAGLRGRSGLGRGDVKLALAVGAWLPLQLIPFCILLASGAALTWVVVRRWRGGEIDAHFRLPFGAFLCPALWLTFFAHALSI